MAGPTTAAVAAFAATATAPPGAAARSAANPTGGTPAAKQATAVLVPAGEIGLQAGDTRFSGRFVRDGDRLSGNGRVRAANGDVCPGDRVKGRRHGRGERIWASGQRYSGSWVDDAPQGKGRLRLANGKVFEGERVRGVPPGAGVRQLVSGEWSGERDEGDRAQGLSPGGDRRTNGGTCTGPWQPARQGRGGLGQPRPRGRRRRARCADAPQGVRTRQPGTRASPSAPRRICSAADPRLCHGPSRPPQRYRCRRSPPTRDARTTWIPGAAAARARRPPGGTAGSGSAPA